MGALTIYSNKRKEKIYDNGFLYPLVYFLIKIMFFLNVVEWLKVIVHITVKWICEENNNVKFYSRRAQGIIIDAFVVLKFIFVILMVIYQIPNFIIVAIIFYLAFMNIFTYFYYHVWDDTSLYEKYLSVHRVRRKLTNLFLSILFNVIVFWYFYFVPFNYMFNWVGESDYQIYTSLLFSFTNTFPTNINLLTPNCLVGKAIVSLQVFITFIFIGIILAKSIPKAEEL